MRADLESRGAGRIRVQRHRAERVDDRRVAEDQCADRRATPGHRVYRNHIGVDLVDVDQPVRRGRGMIDHHQPADLVHQLGDRPQVGHRAQRRRRRRDGDQSGRSCDQALPLPGREFTGLDVDLGPLHLGAIAIRGPQPRCDVRLVVEPGHHHLVAETRLATTTRRPATSAISRGRRRAPHPADPRRPDRRPPGAQRPAPRRCVAPTDAVPSGSASTRGKRSTPLCPQNRAAASRSARRSAPTHRPTTGADHAPGRRRMPCQPTLERL